MGYVDGLYKWSDADWARFPDAIKVRIAALPTTDPTIADVLDIETGDARAEDAPGWIQAREHAGIHEHTLYCNLSTKPAVEVACAGLHWQWFAADPNGTPHMVLGSVATQFAWPDYGSGGHFDLTLCSEYWPVASSVHSKPPQGV